MSETRNMHGMQALWARSLPDPEPPISPASSPIGANLAQGAPAHIAIS